MRTEEIPPEQWAQFLKEFSQEHEGWLVSIELLDEDRAPHKVAQWQPLQGISLDTKGTQPSSLTISVGDQPGTHVRHVVNLPLFIRLASAEQGTDLDVQIEPADGPQTTLHMRQPSH